VKIERFSWCNFRNLQKGELVPDNNVNVIYGRNAQGKTNLLEGMWLFTGERSFRGSKDSELLHNGCSLGGIMLNFYAAGRSQVAKIKIAGGRRTVELNGIKKRSCTSLIGKFCAAVFSPEYLSLLYGGPAGRRNFMDAAICQIKPAYAGLFSKYSRSLAQRNALLKDIPNHAELMDTLDIWDERLVEAGMKIMRARSAYVEKIAPYAEKFYSGMCGGREKFSLKYEQNAPDFASALQKSRRQDMLAGHTCVGPHRDDMAIIISGLDARAYGSQGQKRSAIIALKLAEAEMLKKAIGEAPVIFLDDVLSELDSERQNYLLNRLDGFQVFLTCCGPDISRFPGCGAVFKVEGGRPEATCSLP
jgi:DNA replication and repair protein RecF